MAATTACLTASIAAWSQPAVVTQDDIARARGATPSVSERDIDAAARWHRMPSQGELDRVPVPAAPRLDALPVPQTRPPVDLQSIARGVEALEAAHPRAELQGPKLLVFISFAMPEAALQRLVADAARCDATLVLRGLVDDSLTATVVRVQRLLGARRTAVQIDPQAFERFAIRATPTIVLLRTPASPPCDAARCEDSANYVAAAGDVSLDYALRFFERSAPSFAQDAARLRRRLGS
jgi:conjugal transfer pilus assembly protein TrbC